MFKPYIDLVKLNRCSNEKDCRLVNIKKYVFELSRGSYALYVRWDLYYKLELVHSKDITVRQEKNPETLEILTLFSHSRQSSRKINRIIFSWESVFEGYAIYKELSIWELQVLTTGVEL